MTSFDPFGGNSNYYSKEVSKNNEEKKNNKAITVILVILLIGFGAYYGNKYLLPGKIDVKFDVKNTEKESIPSANIKISKDPTMSNTFLITKNLSTEKIRKGKYYYSVQAQDYKQISGKEINIKDKQEIIENIVLEKNIPLTINSVLFPQKVYAGQQAILEINYKNTSQNKDYRLEDLVISGDINGWEFITVDEWEDPIALEEVILTRMTTSTIKLKYTVKETNKKINKISVRVKYKEEEKSANFEITEEPKVEVKGNVSGDLKSGENKNYTITVDNTKNKVIISDFTIELEVASTKNKDVNNWFTFPSGNILIEQSRNKTIQVSINVPQNARDDDIEGKLIFKSNSFKDPKELNINIKITEPSINFALNTNKQNITLKYDENNNVTNLEYIELTVNNKSTIDIDVLDIRLVDLDPIKKDCNNLVYISPDALGNNKVLKNTAPKILIPITAKDTSLIGSLLNNSRVCQIALDYKHPFREDETQIIFANLIISIE